MSASPRPAMSTRLKMLAKTTLSELASKQGTDMAATLTYYTVLAIFPALLCLVSLLKLSGLGTSLVPKLSQLLTDAIPDQGMADTAVGAVEAFFDFSGAGIGLVIGILTAMWSASGYVGAFSRVANKTYEVSEGRGPVKLKATQLGITAAILIGAAVMIAALTLSSSVAGWIAEQIGAGETLVQVWQIIRWPLVLVVAMTLVGVLYRYAPNVDLKGRKPLTPGAILAVIVAIFAAFGFSFYVANFGSYDATYGALAGSIIALMALWLVNVAMVLGVILDAQRLRLDKLAAGDTDARRGISAKPRELGGIVNQQRAANSLANKLENYEQQS